MTAEKGSKLLRKGRRSIVNPPYLVTPSSKDRENIFQDSTAAAFVPDSLRWFETQGAISLHAAVVVPDHVHFLAALGNTNLPELMRRLKNFTARKINRKKTRRVAPPGFLS